MQAHGSDRVRRGSGEQWILLCPRSKGWVPRTPKTLTASEHPGTAVLWQECYFEVVSATPSGSSIRYVLEPWREEHVMRVVDAYDEASEVRREGEYRASVARTSGRRAANAAAILTGHLPAAVQERLGSELGVLPGRLTLVSLILPMLFVALAIQEHVRRVMTHERPLPLWVILLAMYLLLESGVRLYLAMMQSRPCGSAAGWIVYTVFYLMSPNRRRLPPPVARSPPDRLRLEVQPDVVLQDAFTMREPLLTLLTPAEQRFFEERFGFNYRRSGPGVAVAILLFSAAGVVTSFLSLRDGGGLSPLLSLFAAGGVAAEQVVRLRALRRGPAGSVLGALVRPFTRKLMPRV